MYPTLYNPRDAFETKTSSVKLKKYSDSTVTYLNVSDNPNLLLQKSKAIAIPKKKDVTVTDDLNNPYCRVAGYLKYNKKNYTKLTNSGCIRFVAKKTNCTNDYAYQDFIGFNSLPAGSYTLVINVSSNGNPNSRNYISFETGIDIISVSDLQSLIQRTIENSYMIPRPFKCVVTSDGRLRIQTVYTSGLAVISRIEADKEASADFMACFESEEHNINSYSDNDSLVLGLKEEDSTNNQILFVHKTDGYLYLKMSDSDSSYNFETKLCKWEFTNEEFAEYKLNFDSSLCNFLINGKLIKSFEPVGIGTDETDVNNIIRSDSPATDLILGGEYNSNQSDTYDYTQVIIYDKKQHCGEYNLSEAKYDGSAYVEYNYGQIDAFDDKKLTFTGTGSFVCEMLDGDMIMVSSNSISDFIEKVKEIDYDKESTLSFETANDLIFRIRFKSENSEITSFDFDAGTDSSDSYGFQNVIMWIRRQLGYPQVACELTDDQILDAISEATSEYNKYRNYDKNLQIESVIKDSEKETDLRQGYSEKEGKYYILPSNISDKDIVEIFFHPRYATSWFGAGNDFLDNFLAQTFFSRASDMAVSAADYAIYRLSMNDISNLLGTHISWRIFNNHLYITPNNMALLDQFKIGIVYRQPITIEEIENSMQIKKYALGRSMITLGMIRTTYGGSISIGDTSIQMNGSELINNGKIVMDDALATMKKESYPLNWFIT